MFVLLFVFVCTYFDYKYDWGDVNDGKETKKVKRIKKNRG